jgi:hypothetical protein
MAVTFMTVPSDELALERLAAEARRARPDPNVRRAGPLRLEPDEPLDRRGRGEPLALEQELPCEHCAVQRTEREDSLGHAV